MWRWLDRTLASSHAARRWERTLTAGVYLIGMATTAWLPVAYFYVRRLVATPNQLLSPGWRAPGDGLDDESRRYLKHYLVIGWHLLVGVAVSVRHK